MPNDSSVHLLTTLPLTGAQLSTPLDMMRPGMPAADAIHAVEDFTPQPQGPAVRIIHTTEVDAYEDTAVATKLNKLLHGGGAQAPAPAALASALKAKPKAASGDQYVGTARKAAKLSIASAPQETFTDLKDLIASLTPDNAMIHHKPPISSGATSNRVKEEKRNVKLSAFLYAASAESDNDFHLIIGRDKSLTPEVYMTMEVSGLPPATAASFAALNAARTAYKTYFGSHVPGATYDFYDPPVPIAIEGSLFFDITHATGPHPGPPSLKSRMPTIWEVHPLTAVKLG